MDTDRKIVYTSAFFSTIVMLIIMPLQIIVYSIFPMPATVIDWFAMFRDRPLVAFFHSDFFLMVDNILIAVIYLAFYSSLRGKHEGVLRIGIVLGLIGIAAYISSCKTFELLSLSGKYFQAIPDAEKSAVLAAGYAMIASWQGTAFDAYYVLNAIALLAVSFAMLDDSAYGRTTAIIGLVTGVLMIVPSTAGTVGLVFSLLSLIPWYVFAIRFARVFRRLARA
jgi:hypothetical protein